MQRTFVLGNHKNKSQHKFWQNILILIPVQCWRIFFFADIRSECAIWRNLFFFYNQIFQNLIVNENHTYIYIYFSILPFSLALFFNIQFRIGRFVAKHNFNMDTIFQVNQKYDGNIFLLATMKNGCFNLSEIYMCQNCIALTNLARFRQDNNRNRGI